MKTEHKNKLTSLVESTVMCSQIMLKKILFYRLYNNVRINIAPILGMSRAEVVKWCLDNSFELIEMISEEEEEDEEDGGGTACGKQL